LGCFYLPVNANIYIPLAVISLISAGWSQQGLVVVLGEEDEYKPNQEVDGSQEEFS
jgi:hypothetical protein